MQDTALTYGIPSHAFYFCSELEANGIIADNNTEHIALASLSLGAYDEHT